MGEASATTWPVPGDRSCHVVVGKYLGRPVICGVPLSAHDRYDHPWQGPGNGRSEP